MPPAQTRHPERRSHERLRPLHSPRPDRLPRRLGRRLRPQVLDAAKQLEPSSEPDPSTPEPGQTKPPACRICPACGQALPPRPPGKGGHNQRYCNQACATWHKRHPDTPRPVHRSCLYCQADISDRAITAKFCSNRCRNILNGIVAAPRPTRTCALPECALPFIPKQDRQRCCCEKHGKLLSHREYRAEGREVREEWGDARRERYHRRRALKKKARTGQPVRFAEIAERDQWTCGLCHEQVDPTIAWPDPMSPSLDHVIPLSKGGMHDPSNVQLAHLHCNITKNNRGGGEQLALIG